jgi:hypothetical protein
VQQLGRLFTNVYHTEALARRVDELAARVRPMVAEQGDREADQYDGLVDQLRWRIVQRGEFLVKQLGTTNWMNAPRTINRPRERPGRDQ